MGNPLAGSPRLPNGGLCSVLSGEAGGQDMAFLGLNFEDEDFEGDGRNWPILACDRLRKPNFIGLVSIARAANRVHLSRPTLFSDSLKASWQSNPTGSS